MKRYLPVLLLLTVLFGACQQFEDFEAIDRVDYSAEYAIPLVDTRATIGDLLEDFEEDATLMVDADGSMRFVYRGDVLSQSSREIFGSVDQALPPIIPVTEKRAGLALTTPDGVEIDLVRLKAGDFIYYFESRNDVPVEVIVTLPQIRREGQALQFMHSLPAYDGNGLAPFATNQGNPASLAGYEIEAENDSLFITHEVITPDGSEGELTNFVVRFQDLDFSYAEGYLGMQTFAGGLDTIYIDFFDNWTQGEVEFLNPTVTFEFENSIGIPSRAIINRFNVLTVDGLVLPLQGDFVEEGIAFPYPTLEEVGQTKRLEFVVDTANSNIAPLLGSKPVAVEYDVDVLTHPEGDSSRRGFVTDEGDYSVQVEVDIPLVGNATDFVALDTFDINLSDYGDVDEAEFKVIADNSIPLEMVLQIYFLDAQGRVIDSLLDSPERLVDSAPVNDEGVTTGSSRKESFIPYSGQRLQSILDSKLAAVRAAFSTTEEGSRNVRINSSQDIQIHIGAILQISN
ncbi:MAG: hypothetical protein R3350_03265 [Saprospiraceae bacterium]|nr:hypothetical protein [Saprospiraceae bacterium]